jgi:streptogramin lyase
MFAIRASPLTHQASSRLQLVPNWPQLPPGIRLERVTGVAVDSRGLVYVAHRGDNPLLCLHPDGRLLREVGAEVHRKSVAYDLRDTVPVPMDTRNWLHGLHVDAWDNVWVTDCGRHLVLKFDPAGNLVMTLGVDGRYGCTDRLFYEPTHACVVASGDIFVADGYGNSRVVKFNARGEQLLEWGTRGIAPGEFHTPHVITADRDGLLYVSDRENDRVQVFDQSGRLLSVWPELHSVDGLHAAPDGKVYGAAGLDNAIVEFDRAGRPAEVWAEPGFFCYPHGICVDAAGSIYAAEIAGNRLLKARRVSA